MKPAIGTRRDLIGLGGVLVAGSATLMSLSAAAADEMGVGAVEDLMREHGVLRRALLVYAESAPKIRKNAASVDARALNRTAKLFKAFGEDYHERKLEESYIFPRVRKAGGEAALYIDVLISQHNRGRDITQYILRETAGGHIAPPSAEGLATALESFVRMYANHAAREDTVVFPAWKAKLSNDELNDMGEKFEDIEKKQFGGDGFEKAAKEIGDIEHLLGLADLAQFTAPEPPIK